MEMRKLIVAGVVALLAVMVLAGTAEARPHYGYGYARPAYGYGYGYRVAAPPVVVNPYPYGYYHRPYYAPRYYPRARYWHHRW
jgi:hypothetical protein